MPIRVVSIDFVQDLETLALKVRSAGYQREGEILQHVASICLTSPNYGGLGLTPSTPIAGDVASEVLLLITACK